MVTCDSSVWKISFIIISHVNTNLKVNVNCYLAVLLNREVSTLYFKTHS